MRMARRIIGSVSGLTILSVVLVVVIYKAWLAYGAPGRIEPGLLERADREGSISAAVVLPFRPERFHISKIQAEGRIRRVNGNTVELRAINRDGIEALAGRYYWIEKINGL